MIEEQVANGVGKVLSGDNAIVTVLGLLCLALGYVIKKLWDKFLEITERLISVGIESNKVIAAFNEQSKLLMDKVLGKDVK